MIKRHSNTKQTLEHFHRITPTISTISVDTEKIRKGIKRVAKPGRGNGADNTTSTGLNLVGNFASTGLQQSNAWDASLREK